MTKEEKAAYWRSTLDQQNSSGQPATVFCREHNLNIHQFRWWKKRFKNDQQKTDRAQFIELIARNSSHKSGIRIQLGNRICIEVEQGFDPRTLLNVIETLSGK